MNTQPEALRLAAWLNEGAWHQMKLGDVEAAGRELRRQHADIERKDALLRQALEALSLHGGAYLHHESQYKAATIAITSELSK